MAIFLPILFFALILAGLSIYGFSTAAGNISAFLTTLPNAGMAAVGAGRAAWRNLRRQLWRFALWQSIGFLVAFAIAAYGVSIDGFRKQSIIVAVSSLFFGVQLAATAVIADELEKAVRTVLNRLAGFTYYLARIVVGFLAIFQVAQPLPPRTAPPTTPNQPIQRTLMEWLLMPAALVWFWNAMWIVTFPSWITMGIVIPLDFFLLFGGLLVRWLRETSKFWRRTFMYMLPFCATVFLAHFIFPRAYEGTLHAAGKFATSTGRTVEGSLDRVGCRMEGEGSTDPACKQLLIRDAAEALEKIAAEGERTALKHGAKRTTVNPTPPPTGGAPYTPLVGEGEADLPPPAPPTPPPFLGRR